MTAKTPEFADAKPIEEEEKPVTPAILDKRRQDDKEDRKDEPQIVYNERVILPNGTVDTRQHGPMPVADWPAYEKEKGF